VTTISIVTPSLNQGKFLREALESVSTQNYTQIEHLVLDGGSTDQTLPVLRSFNDDKAWDHLRWTSAPDNGQSDALNRGFAQARGDIIGWLNSDDRYRRGCFEHIVKTFDEHPEVDILYGDFTVMNESGKLLELRREIAFNRFILFYHRVLYIPTPATFFRRRVFEDGNRLRTDLHYAMDYEFFLRLARAGYRIRHTPRLLADFRLHPASKSCSDVGRPTRSGKFCTPCRHSARACIPLACADSPCLRSSSSPASCAGPKNWHAAITSTSIALSRSRIDYLGITYAHRHRS
jgi:glycosyltransferase involved in cell wall biosynthesis